SAPEAMAAGRPGGRAGMGGPLETVSKRPRGVLFPPPPQAFAEALARLIANPGMAERMGQAGRLHVAQPFSLAAFGTRLEAIIQELVAPGAGHDCAPLGYRAPL